MKRMFMIMLAACMLVGCSTTSCLPRRPAPINHVVFFTLDDPVLIDDFIRDCDTILTAIPGIVAFACGRHVDAGRANVNDDYHVAVYMGFMNLDDYRAYLEHADHQALIAKWRPHIIARQTYDMLDETGP